MLGKVHLISKCPLWLSDCGSTLRDQRPRLGITEHRSLIEVLGRSNGHTPSCVVLDLSQLDLSGEECCRMLRERQRAGLALILTAESPPAREVVRALHQGVIDYLGRETVGTDLLEAVDSALSWSRQVAHLASEIKELDTRFGRLTVREIEVLDLMALGKMSKEIARDLFINKRTVDYHRERILHRVEARSAIEVLSLFARRERFEQQLELLLRGAHATDDPRIHGTISTCRVDAEDRVVDVDTNWLRLARERGYLENERDIRGEKIWSVFMPTRTLDMYAKLFEQVRRSMRAVDFDARHQGAEHTAQYRVHIRPLPQRGLEVLFQLIKLETCEGPLLSVVANTQPNSEAICEQCSRLSLAGEWLDFEEARRRRLITRAAAQVTYELCGDCSAELHGLLDSVLVG